jgi:hypothetical protein
VAPERIVDVRIAANEIELPDADISLHNLLK